MPSVRNFLTVNLPSLAKAFSFSEVIHEVAKFRVSAVFVFNLHPGINEIGLSLAILHARLPEVPRFVVHPSFLV